MSTILVVDDEPALRDMLRLYLEQEGFHVVEAGDGRRTASSRDIFGCSKNRQNRIVENSTYPLDDFGFR